MKFSLIVLGITLSILSSEAAILDYSNITPWSVVYAVYPVYNPEPWVEVWKNERSLNFLDNTVEIRSRDQKINDIVNVNNETSDSRDPHQQENNKFNNRENSLPNTQAQHPQQTHLWPLNYRNWPKSSTKEDH